MKWKVPNDESTIPIGHLSFFALVGSIERKSHGFEKEGPYTHAG
jgi:hypothetical protein